MRFFVGGDVGLVLQGGADIVEAFEQDFLARWRDFKFVDQAVLVADGLVRQVDGKGIAFFLFGALEEFFDPGCPNGCGLDPTNPSGWGAITAQGNNPRQMQFGIRLKF